MHKIICLILLTFFELANGEEKIMNKKELTEMQKKVTKEGATEPAFQNEYWDNKKPGIYVDIHTGEALFSSTDKYDSGSGWPSFTKGINDSNFTTKLDSTFGLQRVELKTKNSDSHLGHVFDDGPKDKGGKRFCVNSAALNFIPLEEMEKKGYGEYLKLFDGAQSSNVEVAILAGGCFWGMEDLIRKVPGVLNTEVGYTGGSLELPTYEKVKSGQTGHAEAIRVEFDRGKLTYQALLEFYFRIHDPTTVNQQGNDKGTQYRSAIFFTDIDQQKIAQEVIKKVDQSKKWNKPIVTQIAPFTQFFKAEDYHQDYLVKNPKGYTCHWVRN